MQRNERTFALFVFRQGETLCSFFLDARAVGGGFLRHQGLPQPSLLIPVPDGSQSEPPHPQGEAWLSSVGGRLARPIFPGRIPADTTTTGTHLDREVLSVVIIGHNYVR